MTFEEIINHLNEAAGELLSEAQDLENIIENAANNPEALRRQLDRICGALTRLIDFLEQADSPLKKFVDLLGGTRVSHARDTLKKYLGEHRAAFEKLGASKDMVDRAMNALETSAQGDEDGLDKPQTVLMGDVLVPLKEFRDLVCQIANGIQIALNPVEIAKQVVKGTIGAATVVVDVTGVISGAHAGPVGGWVLFKAVKSVWSGVRSIRSAVSNIREMVRRK